MNPSPDDSNVFSVRDAQPGEMPAITELAVAAFTTFEVFGPSWWSDAGVLPAILSGVSGSLSRVAVDKASGRMVGHAQWTPVDMHLGRQAIRAAWLAPLSVHPAWQNRGVGGVLIRDGIACLRAARVDLLVILGHDAYYPRFGLLTGCHGRHGLTVPLPKPLPEDPAGWRLRPVAVGDPEACRGMWRQLCGGIDGAVDPGEGLLPWVSKTRDIVSCVLERGGKVVGHARFDKRPGAGAEKSVLRFLAADAEAAAVLAGRLVAMAGWQGDSLYLPLPAASRAVQGILASLVSDGAAIVPVHETWPAGMAMALRDGNAGAAGADPGTVDVAAALAAIRRGDAPPLYLEWPPVFDF